MSFKPQDPAVAAAVQELKRSVKSHWEDETCGTRYASADDRLAWFDEISRSRRSLEPYIADFANFLSASGKRVLEIGVGAGADFEQWCRVAEHATGVDLTEAAVRLTTERMGLRNIPPERFDLRTADAEALPFPDNSFDIVWSWGGGAPSHAAKGHGVCGVAATRGVSILNLDRAICPRLPVCDALVDGEVVRRDRDHLDYRFVPHMACPNWNANC